MCNIEVRCTSTKVRCLLLLLAEDNLIMAARSTTLRINFVVRIVVISENLSSPTGLMNWAPWKGGAVWVFLARADLKCSSKVTSCDTMMCVVPILSSRHIIAMCVVVDVVFVVGRRRRCRPVEGGCHTRSEARSQLLLPATTTTYWISNTVSMM